MSDILVKILMSMAMSLLTKAFVSKMVVYVLRAIADDTGKNKVAEEVVDAVADALDVQESGRSRPSKPAA